jgi:hypothetical protein
LHSAQRFTARSVALRPLLHSAQHASKIGRCHQDRAERTSQDKVDRSKQTKPVAQKGFDAFFFVSLAPMKNLVGTPELAPWVKKA